MKNVRAFTIFLLDLLKNTTIAGGGEAASALVSVQSQDSEYHSFSGYYGVSRAHHSVRKSVLCRIRLSWYIPSILRIRAASKINLW